MKTNIMIITAVGIIMEFSVSANAAVSCGTVFPNENCSAWSTDLGSTSTNCSCQTCNTGYCRIGASKSTSYGGVTYKLYNTCTKSESCDGEDVSSVTLCTSSLCHYQSVTIGGQLYCRIKDSSVGCNKGSHVVAASMFSKYCANYYGVTGSGSGCFVFACDEGYAVNSAYNACNVCASGYYGNGTTCTQCPQWSGVYTDSARTTPTRGTSTKGTTAITGCYIGAGTYYDLTGTFKISNNCQYE